MKIVSASDFGVVASMEHSCGHIVEMWYAAEEFALSDVESMKARPCLQCRVGFPLPIPHCQDR